MRGRAQSLQGNRDVYHLSLKTKTCKSSDLNSSTRCLKVSKPACTQSLKMTSVRKSSEIRAVSQPNLQKALSAEKLHKNPPPNSMSILAQSPWTAVSASCSHWSKNSQSTDDLLAASSFCVAVCSLADESRTLLLETCMSWFPFKLKFSNQS